MKFWPSYLLINVKEEGEEGERECERKGREREKGEVWVCGVDYLISVCVLRLM